MSPPVVVVAALCARMLAESARRAGWRVIVLDLFGDTDTRRASGMWHPIGDPASLSIDPQRTREALDAASRTPNVIGWIAGAGFEAHRDLLDDRRIPLATIGNARESYDAVRDPVRFFALLDDAGIPHPEIQLQAPIDPVGWLEKDANGTGGMHIRHAAQRHATGASGGGRYFQRQQPGRSMSALFIADTRKTTIIGFNEQLIVPHGGQPFVYGGAIGPVDVPDAVRQQIAAAVNAIVLRTRLKGLNSLDFIVDGERCFVLEVNARPSATMSLYERDSNRSLLSLHVRACAGASLDTEASNIHEHAASLCGEQIVFSDRDRTVSPEFVQRALNLGWCHDIPVTGSFIAAGAPLCSVSAVCAHGTQTATVRAELAARAATIASIDTTRKPGHADLLLPR
ncbi:ATP-grasp domain-containing protein [Paraburkholderia hospita]|jgi:predicted ATP-grasp superfamily ATP-dependent carboligase|uniref:ATP-grasp domain-containing protein n=1 Tax=Paraburkholderia hospita TaxID=169430 RepID=UPI000B93C931|nr:ATP-grasp domain-containing protein [Paraburkholderia hospita]AXF02039.1 ATP-binding protein [Paraburkholderia hospita]